MLITVGTLILRVIKESKAKRACAQSTAISNAVLPFIREAERFTHFTGLEKKIYVMTKAAQFAIANKIKFDESLVSNKVEELITLTRLVNAKSRPKEKSQIEQELQELKSQNLDQDWL